MGIITALTRQKRDPERVNVYLDNAFAFGLDALVAARLRVGQELTAVEQEALKSDDEVEKAKNTAVRYIEYRPRSIAEVKKNLASKAYSEPVIELVIDRLVAVDLLNDEKFARYWVDQRESFKPRSLLALRQELHQKGVNRATIDKVLSNVDESDAAFRAGQAKARRWQHLPEQEFKTKLGQFLQRRGFSYTIVRDVTAALWHGADDAHHREFFDD